MNSSALVDPSSQLGEREFEQVRQLIRKEAGIDLSDSKRGMVYGRLTRRLRDLGIADFGAYLRLVSQPHSSELQQFVNALTTNHTSFFREAYHFPMLAELLRNERPADGGTWRIWSSAASSGQEAYSIAMLGDRDTG
ncbi:MAG: CheR family methyltransferase [Burkholderiaceae bacterium]